MTTRSEPFVPAETGAKRVETTLRTKYHRGRKKQKTLRILVEVIVEYPLRMPDNLCFEYGQDVERRVVNYAKAAARAESKEHVE